MHHADAMTTPLLYAELLPNLQQVNVFIELHSPAIQATTSLCLSASGTLLTLHHELGENHESDISLPLPSPVKPPPPPPTVTNTQALTVIPGSKSWSRAFSLLSGKTFAPPEPDVNQVPWSAPELVSLNPGFNCAHCHAELLRPGKIKTWKDLPNHNWAEMMDFWHCHKPHEKGDTEKDKAATKRTNKANGRGIGGFAAEEGVGLVDLTFLLLNSRDVVGIEIVESEKVCDSWSFEVPFIFTSCFELMTSLIRRVKRRFRAISCSPRDRVPQWLSRPIQLPKINPPHVDIPDPLCLARNPKSSS